MSVTNTFFTPERAMERFFYIQGLTKDEFYTDGGMNVNLEWLLYCELKRCGYERIVFFSSEWKFYCYDEESFQLMEYGRPKKIEVEKTPKKKGLKKGRWEKQTVVKQAGSEPEASEKEDKPEGNTSLFDFTGMFSKLKMLAMQSHSLARGSNNQADFMDKMNAYMNDEEIRTAVIIQDANFFLQNAPLADPDWVHKMSRFMGLPGTNTNILIFVYPKKDMQSMFELRKNFCTEEVEKPENIIEITSPNALEIRNMLTALRYSKDLKTVSGKSVRLRMKGMHLLDTALEIGRYVKNNPEEPVENRALYHKLVRFAEVGKELTPENCHEVFGCKKLKSGKEQMDMLIGMESVKSAIGKIEGKPVDSKTKVKNLRSSRILPAPPAEKETPLMHVILTGNPGTGKTTVAELMGQIFYELGYLASGHVVKTDRSGLVAGYVGQTAIKTRKKVLEALGGVLFIDEAYSLYRSDDDVGSNHDFGREAIDTLVNAMTEFSGQFIVVAAGYPNEMETFLKANSGLASRFPLKLHIDDYTPEEMYQILVKKLAAKGCRISDTLEAKMSDFCENWVNLAGEDWGNAREAETLCDALESSWKNDPQRASVFEGEAFLKIIEERHIPEAMKEYLTPVAEMRAQVMQKLQELPGLEGVKRQIEIIQQDFIVGDNKKPGHYIFAGSPGTGKTTVARYMGQILRNHGMLKRGHLVEKTADQLIKEVAVKGFDKIASKALDGVLFIDEAYQLLNSSCGRDIIDSLVSFMENNEERLCVICAGYEENMEQFVDANPGLKSRFKEIILFENYSGKVLHSILLHMLHKEGISWDEDYEEYSLRALTRYAKLHEKDKDFGNARYIRTKYIPHSKSARNRRLIAAYGEEIPKEELNRLTGKDIPEELVKYTKEKLPKEDTRTAMEKLDSLIGFEEIKKELYRLLKSAKYRKEDGSGVSYVPETLHWVLKGNPGTGKSTIAQMIGLVYRECGILTKGHTEKVTRSDLVAEYLGQTATKTRKCIRKAMDGVLFIDEAYSLGTDDYGTEAITELVEAMSSRNGEFAVVAAGYPDAMDTFLKNNDGLRSRMKIFTIEDYNASELHQIMGFQCKKIGFELSEALDQKMELFFANYKGRESVKRQWANGREVENLVREMQSLWFENQMTEKDEDGYVHRIFTEDHIPEELKRYLKGKPEKKKAEKPIMQQIDEMIGFEDVKTNLKENLQLAETSKREDMPELLDGLTLHWVLEGNPGTGKTTVAKMIGKAYKEMGLLERGHCVKVTRADLVAGYVGQTAEKTKKCIEQAMGGVLFIDEAYMLKREGQSGNDFGQEAIDTILEAMSDKNGEFAVIAAGYPKEMKVFLESNPGFSSRFSGQIFYLKDYNAEELARIFASICEKQKFEIGEDLRETLESLFSKMLEHKTPQWANGREAENLEKKMRKIWAKDPEIRKEEDEKVKVYRKRHLPEAYQKYLETRVKEKEEPKKETEEKKQPDIRLPKKALAAPLSNYNYPDAMEEQEKGIVLITSDGDNGERALNGSGSGFMITSDGFVVTCRHVVANAKNVSVRLRIPGRSTGDISWHKAEVVHISKKYDMALLKIDVMGYPYLPVRTNPEDTVKGEGCFILAYPFGKKLSDNLDELQSTLFQGYIGSIQIKEGIERINVNMEAKRGCSGGAVFSKADGTVLGILCGSQIHGDSKLREEVNYVLPMRYILEEILQN